MDRKRVFLMVNDSRKMMTWKTFFSTETFSADFLRTRALGCLSFLTLSRESWEFELVGIQRLSNNLDFACRSPLKVCLDDFRSLRCCLSSVFRTIQMWEEAKAKAYFGIWCTLGTLTLAASLTPSHNENNLELWEVYFWDFRICISFHLDSPKTTVPYRTCNKWEVMYSAELAALLKLTSTSFFTPIQESQIPSYGKFHKLKRSGNRRLRD